MQEKEQWLHCQRKMSVSSSFISSISMSESLIISGDYKHFNLSSTKMSFHSSRHCISRTRFYRSILLENACSEEYAQQLVTAIELKLYVFILQQENLAKQLAIVCTATTVAVRAMQNRCLVTISESPELHSRRWECTLSKSETKFWANMLLQIYLTRNLQKKLSHSVLRVLWLWIWAVASLPSRSLPHRSYRYTSSLSTKRKKLILLLSGRSEVLNQNVGQPPSNYNVESPIYVSHKTNQLNQHVVRL